MSYQTGLLCVALLLAVGCTSTVTDDSAPIVPAPDYRKVAHPYFPDIARAKDATAKDRAAILAMRGDYRVDFHFQETVPLQANYQAHDDKDSGGYETVIVVQDTPNHIVLQHILVAPGGHVVKHWRQDWTYQAPTRFEFVADQRWAVRELAPEKTQQAWTQCVFEVSDAPRYCGTGRWNHRYGVSTWTSDRTWRPLPRREYTKRDDYNAINAENRHTIAPSGWTHEQDNTKTVRDGERTVATLVREFGFNDYRSIVGYDFAPAHEYWRDTASYWANVRAAWDERLRAGHTLTLGTEVDGMPIIEGTFAQADRAADSAPQEQLAAIESLLQQWTTVAPPPG